MSILSVCACGGLDSGVSILHCHLVRLSTLIAILIHNCLEIGQLLLLLLIVFEHVLHPHTTVSENPLAV